MKMKINSSGKERSHKLLQANCHIRSILLAPIEKPNIPSSIDTLDEQKTDKKPKDKKKKKKKKKDEEQDNPADVQDNNVLT
jgi:hypothetical protein